MCCHPWQSILTAVCSKHEWSHQKIWEHKLFWVNIVVTVITLFPLSFAVRWLSGFSLRIPVRRGTFSEGNYQPRQSTFTMNKLRGWQFPQEKRCLFLFSEPLNRHISENKESLCKFIASPRVLFVMVFCKKGACGSVDIAEWKLPRIPDSRDAKIVTLQHLWRTTDSPVLDPLNWPSQLNFKETKQQCLWNKIWFNFKIHLLVEVLHVP